MQAPAKARYVARDKGYYAVQALDRAIDILEAFRTGDEDLGVAEVAARVDLHRATIHRLLSSLTSRGLVAQDLRTGKYRLGLKLFELGSRVGAALDVKRIATPYLANLVSRGGETAHLVILDGRHIVFVDKAETPNPFRMVSVVGGRLPAHCSGAGKALLARLPDDELRALLASRPLEQQTPHSIADPELMFAHLRTVRQQGYAIDDQETQAGLRCVGTVVVDHRGQAVAGLSVSGPIARVTDERIPFFVDLLLTTAEQLSRALGYRG
ncbi:MAG: IclR family transcriptional regulator [Chloroflexi bacterium]|nr:IclR family transcriptional regulator [Chloroflexota bacterium]